MRQIASISRFRTLYLGSLAVFVVVAVGNELMAAQDEKPIQVTVRRASNAIDDAIRIVGFRLDGNYYDFEKSRASPPINTTPGWLERLEIDVKNISPKTVVAGTIQVECPSINHGPQDQMIMDQFTLGIVPDRANFHPGVIVISPLLASNASTKPSILIEPNHEMTFVLGQDLDRTRGKAPPSGPFPDCTVWPVVFYFSDGTYWVRRHFYKPDPNSDHGYIEISPKEFGMVIPAY
ncbi:MAG: hypothetical protein ACLQM6_07870 [Acidobacteriaceae bacterium]